MSDQLKIGLMGTGRIGQVHAACVASVPETTLHWVCDPFVDGAKATAERYGAARVAIDPAEVLESGDVDAIIVASPTPTHVDLISAAIDAAIPVLCEKPIDLDIARVDALREKARAASVPVILGFNRRFDPHFAELHRRVERGDIGRLEQLTITSRDPEPAPAAYIAVSGGIFRDMTIHDFDMARFFVPDIVEVTARGAQQFSTVIAEAGDYDAVVVTLRGAGGELITITNSRHCAYGYDQRIEAFGPGGLLQVGNVGPTVVRAYGAESVEGIAPYHSFFLERYTEAYRLELAAFVEAIHGRPSTSPGFEDGRAALVLADAAVRSAAEGVSVDVDLNA
jgi:myo-inositol 2-dehydrogenase/D-chiro-inositol 1-dehydrogenase